MPNESLGDFYSGVSLAYAAGGASVLAESYYYQSRYAVTRYNTVGKERKIQQYLEEILTGYGTMPFRVLCIIVALYFLSVIVFVTKIKFDDSLILAAGALLTFGGFTDQLSHLGIAYRIFYILISFCGVSLTALFMTTLAAKWLNKR